MLAGFVAAWIAIGAPYFMSVLRAPADLALLYSLLCAIVMAIVLANLFWLGGIEGYETNGRLKPYFADIVETGIKGDAIAQAIVGISVSRVNFGRAIWAIAGTGMALFGIMLLIAARGGLPYFQWIGFFGIGAAAHVGAALGRPEGLVLPGGLIWLGGVRRSYERMLGKRPQPGFVSGTRALMAFSMGFPAVTGILLLYFMIGFQWTISYQRGANDYRQYATLAMLSSAAIVVGTLAGLIWGLATEINLMTLGRRLAEEMERLFDLRRERIHEGEPKNS